MAIDSNRIERAGWDSAWSAQPVRRLPLPVRIDVKPTPSDHWGEPIEVLAASVPPQFDDRLYFKVDACPICGVETTEDERVAVSLYPKFERLTTVGIPAWAHAHCLAACEQVPGPAPIPW